MRLVPLRELRLSGAESVFSIASGSYRTPVIVSNEGYDTIIGTIPARPWVYANVVIDISIIFSAENFSCSAARPRSELDDAEASRGRRRKAHVDESASATISCPRAENPRLLAAGRGRGLHAVAITSWIIGDNAIESSSKR